LLCNQSVVDGGRPVDELLDGLQRAAEDGRWTPDPQAESRRLDLIPQRAPVAWDELMHHDRYLQALERIV
jgi:beta-N-acetylhexosaminidase